MFKTLTSLPTLIITGPITLTVLITAMILTPLLLLNYLEETDAKIFIRPEMNITNEIVTCLEGAEPLKVAIEDPDLNQEFSTNDEIKFKGVFAFACEQLLKEKFETTLTHEWFLNNETTTFSTLQEGNMGKKAEGDYTIKYKLNIAVEGVEEVISAQIDIPFKVVAPAPVLGVVTPAPRPNTAPSAQIDRNSIIDSGFDRQGYYQTIIFYGSGFDAEDGTNITLNWSYVDELGNVAGFGSGTNATVTLHSMQCFPSPQYTINLVAVDSRGASSAPAQIIVTIENPQCVG